MTNNGVVFSDIDECLEDNICPEICNNTPGSYTCKCHDGGVYDPLKKQCLRHGQSRLAGINTISQRELLCLVLDQFNKLR